MYAVYRPENVSGLIPTVKIETRYPVEGTFGNEFSSIYDHCGDGQCLQLPSQPQGVEAYPCYSWPISPHNVFLDPLGTLVLSADACAILLVDDSVLVLNNLSSPVCIFLVHGQVTIIFVVSVDLSVCLFVCLFVQSFSQPSLIRFRSN